MLFQETNAEVLKHLSTCPECRKELFRQREALCLNLPDYTGEQGKIPCDAVLPSDIFDYTIPYGIDPADDEYAEFREPLASHLGGCPTCLAKVQALHKTIHSIIERPESDVVTVFHVDAPVSADDQSRADHARQGRTINFTARLRRMTSSPKVKPWFGVSAAAAVVLMGLAFMFSDSAVEAVSQDQVRTAIQDAINLHISVSYTDEVESTQELWISRSRGFYMVQNEKEVVFSDFMNKLQKKKHRDSNEVEIIGYLPDGMDAGINKNLADFLNLLLSAPVSEEQKERNWERVTDKVLSMANENYEVYDMKWTQITPNGSLTPYQRRFFVDPETSLPTKIQVRRKSSTDDGYSVVSETIIEQMDDNQMQAAVDIAFP